ncbi:MAG: hypothetical protein HQK51_09095 [Oligoflexia bacterium]|nr:hypothetical protein [Oligoflexia bacterium]
MKKKINKKHLSAYLSFFIFLSFTINIMFAFSTFSLSNYSFASNEQQVKSELEKAQNEKNQLQAIHGNFHNQISSLEKEISQFKEERAQIADKIKKLETLRDGDLFKEKVAIDELIKRLNNEEQILRNSLDQTYKEEVRVINEMNASKLIANIPIYLKSTETNKRIASSQRKMLIDFQKEIKTTQNELINIQAAIRENSNQRPILSDNLAMRVSDINELGQLELAEENLQNKYALLQNNIKKLMIKLVNIKLNTEGDEITEKNMAPVRTAQEELNKRNKENEAAIKLANSQMDAINVKIDNKDKEKAKIEVAQLRYNELDLRLIPQLIQLVQNLNSMVSSPKLIPSSVKPACVPIETIVIPVATIPAVVKKPIATTTLDTYRNNKEKNEFITIKKERYADDKDNQIIITIHSKKFPRNNSETFSINEIDYKKAFSLNDKNKKMHVDLPESTLDAEFVYRWARKDKIKVTIKKASENKSVIEPQLLLSFFVQTPGPKLNSVTITTGDYKSIKIEDLIADSK